MCIQISTTWSVREILKVAEDEALATLKGFLFAQKENRNNKVYGLDSAIQTNGIDKATERYLKGV